VIDKDATMTEGQRANTINVTTVATFTQRGAIFTRLEVVDFNYAELSELTALKTFITGLAGHIAAEAGRG
jgi:hypothetical protein